MYIVWFTESSLEVQCEPAVVITARLHCVLCYFNHCLSCKVVCINMERGREWSVECKGTCNGMWNWCKCCNHPTVLGVGLLQSLTSCMRATHLWWHTDAHLSEDKW